MVIVLEDIKILAATRRSAVFNDFIYKIRRRLDDTLPMKIRMLSRWHENLLEVTRKLRDISGVGIPCRHRFR